MESAGLGSKCMYGGGLTNGECLNYEQCQYGCIYRCALQSIIGLNAAARERSGGSRIRAGGLRLAFDLRLHFDALLADVVVLNFD